MYESNGFGRHGVIADLENSLLPSGQENDRVRVLGHRGSPGRGRPENSVAALARALRRGADGVEVDVRLTAEDVLVCAHDPFVLDRTGARVDVASSTSGDLREAAGSLATLVEILGAAQGRVGFRVVVEAKPVPDPATAARTANALAAALRAAAGSADVTISSFDPALLTLIRATCADLPVRTALLGDGLAPAIVVVRRAYEDGHDEVHLALASVRRTPTAVEMARWLGLSIVVWTVNRRRDLLWMTELEVDGVITDDVKGALRELSGAVELTAA